MNLDYDIGYKDLQLFPSNIRIVYNEEGKNIAKFLKYTSFNYNDSNVWNNQNKYIQQLKTYIEKESVEYINRYIPETSIHLGRGWVQLYKTGQNIDIHHHGYSLLACVFYVSVPENGGDLILVDPRGSVIEYNIFSQESAFNATSARFIPKEGALIFFPGYMLHYTERNLSNDNRICIAANFFRTEQLTTKEKILPDEEYTSN